MQPPLALAGGVAQRDLPAVRFRDDELAPCEREDAALRRHNSAAACGVDDPVAAADHEPERAARDAGVGTGECSRRAQQRAVECDQAQRAGRAKARAEPLLHPEGAPSLVAVASSPAPSGVTRGQTADGKQRPLRAV